MSTLWGDNDELPPPCTTQAKAPEVFDDLPGKSGVESIFESHRERTGLQPGVLVRVNKTGSTGVVIECFSTYVKLHNGEAHSRHAVKVLCGVLSVGFQDRQFREDVKIAQHVLEGLTGPNGVVVFKDLLAPGDRKAVAKEAKHLCQDPNMFTAGTGTGENHARSGNLRGDETMWLPKDGSLPRHVQYVIDKVNRLRRALCHVKAVALDGFSIQLARYPGDGIGYVKHRDVKLNAPQENRRRITCLYYCNEDWTEADGGCLELYPNSRLSQHVEAKSDSKETNSLKAAAKTKNPITVQPVSGTLVLFLSSMLHCVLPEHAPRIAITMWMSGPEPLGLDHPMSAHSLDTHFTNNDDIYPSR